MRRRPLNDVDKRLLVRDRDVANWIEPALHPGLISGDKAVAVTGVQPFRELQQSTMSHIEGSAAFQTNSDRATLTFDPSPLIVIRNSGKDHS